MAPLRALVGQMLEQHMPYPALVIDGAWQVVDANASARALLLGKSSLPVSLCDVMVSPATRALLMNWAEVARAGVERLRHELDARPSAGLERQLAALEDALAAHGGGTETDAADAGAHT